MVLKTPILARFIEQYKSFWVQNGDNISRFYAGTRALDGKTKVRRKEKVLVSCYSKLPKHTTIAARIIFLFFKNIIT